MVIRQIDYFIFHYTEEPDINPVIDVAAFRLILNQYLPFIQTYSIHLSGAIRQLIFKIHIKLKELSYENTYC